MKQYKSFAEVLYVYWQLYGGWKALLLSPYFGASILISGVSYPFWRGDWSPTILGAVPNLLGFSIGAFAVILSFGQNAMSLLKNPVEIQSKYLGVIVAFLHFIVVQVLALIIAFVGKAWPGSIVLGALGVTVGAYAIVLALAAAFRLFRLARLYNQVQDGAAKVDED